MAFAFAIPAATATSTAAATVSAATTAAAAATAAKVPAGRALFTGARLVDDKIPAINLLAVQSFDRLLGFLGAAHGDKTETAWTMGHFVHHQHGLCNSAEWREKFLKCSFRGLEGKITDIEFHD